jgi:hypothetical protein
MSDDEDIGSEQEQPAHRLISLLESGNDTLQMVLAVLHRIETRIGGTEAALRDRRRN